MDLRFATFDLRKLDQAATEVLIAPVLEGERPPRGTAALVDWRLAGRISRLMKSGYVTGRLGEVVLIPGKPRLPFDKVLLFGMGTAALFDESGFRRVIEKMLSTLAGLRAHTAVVELPGRYAELISAERAIELLVECAGVGRQQDVWTLIESEPTRKLLLQRRLQDRRRDRG